MMKSVALEGSSFSGKTTLSQKLSECFGAPVIDEYINYALRVNPNGFPSFATSEEELAEQIDFYAGLEAVRKHDLVQAIGALAIVDRTAASLVAFQRTQKNRRNDDETYWGPQEMEMRIERDRALGRVIVPDLVIVLSAGTREEHDARVQERGPIMIDHLRELNEWGFSEDLRQNTIDALDSIYPSAVKIECVTDSNPRTLAEIIANIEDITEVKQND